MRLMGRIGIASVLLVVLAGLCEVGAPSGPDVENGSTLVLRIGGSYLESGESPLVSRTVEATGMTASPFDCWHRKPISRRLLADIAFGKYEAGPE